MAEGEKLVRRAHELIRSGKVKSDWHDPAVRLKADMMAILYPNRDRPKT